MLWQLFLILINKGKGTYATISQFGVQFPRKFLYDMKDDNDV